MDLSIFNNLGTENLLNVQTLLVGIVTAGLVELAKRLKSIPLSEKQTTRIRYVAGGLAFAGVALTRYLDGTIDQQFLELVGQTLVGYIMSYLTYKSLIKTNEKK
jgi:hypothetical protein